MDVREAHAFYVELFAQHGVGDWKIRWNRMAGTAGITNYRTKTVTFSARAVEVWDWPLTVQLGLHELAHVLVGRGHAHGSAWKKQVRSLGGLPEEHCPRFSTDLARFLGRFGEGHNPMFVALLLVAAWIAASPVGLVLTLVVTGAAVVAGIRNSRPVLPAREREEIERLVLSV